MSTPIGSVEMFLINNSTYLINSDLPSNEKERIKNRIFLREQIRWFYEKVRNNSVFCPDYLSHSGEIREVLEFEINLKDTSQTIRRGMYKIGGFIPPIITTEMYDNRQEFMISNYYSTVCITQIPEDALLDNIINEIDT